MNKILILQHAVVQMVRIGNKVNWNEPIDMEYVDALNGLRNLLAAQQKRAADSLKARQNLPAKKSNRKGSAPAKSG